MTDREQNQAVEQRMAAIAQDLADIAELHLRLLAADLRAIKRGSSIAAVLLVVALVLLGAAVPTAVIGVGILIAEQTELSMAGGLFLAAALSIAIAAATAAAARWQFRRQRDGLHRSREQLRTSVDLIEKVLSRDQP
jgi:cell division protein FtsW (lipid II flippase)